MKIGSLKILCWKANMHCMKMLISCPVVKVYTMLKMSFPIMMMNFFNESSKLVLNLKIERSIM